MKVLSDCRRGALSSGKAFLHREGNGTTLILAILICAVASLLPSVVIARPLIVLIDWDALYYSSPFWYNALTVLEIFAMYVALFFTAIPIYLGLYRMAVRMSREESTSLIDVFYFFSSGKRYKRALGILWITVLRMCPVYFALVYFLQMFIAELDLGLPMYQFAVSFGIVVMLALLSCFLLAFSGGFVTVALVREDFTLRACRTVARTMSKGKKKSHFLFLLSLLWRMFLALLPAGVVLIIYTLPLALLANANYVGRCLEADGNHI